MLFSQRSSGFALPAHSMQAHVTGTGQSSFYTVQLQSLLGEQCHNVFFPSMFEEEKQYKPCIRPSAVKLYDKSVPFDLGGLGISTPYLPPNSKNSLLCSLHHPCDGAAGPALLLSPNFFFFLQGRTPDPDATGFPHGMGQKQGKNLRPRVQRAPAAQVAERGAGSFSFLLKGHFF